MRKRLWLYAAIALAAAVLGFALLRLRSGEKRAADRGPSLWYCETDCPRPVMEALLAACEAETGEKIDAVSFPDEETLAEAFESRRPELLLCGHARAAGIDGRLGLARLKELPGLPAVTEDALRGLEGAFCPIGGRVPLLVSRAEAADLDFASFEALLHAAAEADAPFLAAESWSELLFQAMSSRGREMSGRPDEDSRDAVYCELYNALAEAAWAGGLTLVPDAAEYVRRGLVPCAVVSSTALAGAGEAELRAAPLPVPEGGREGCCGELMGFALVETGKHASAIRGFLRWLTEGERAAETALSLGLVPLTPEAGEAERGETERLLLSLAEEGALRWPPASLSYFANREACEAALLERLDLLG